MIPENYDYSPDRNPSRVAQIVATASLAGALVLSGCGSDHESNNMNPGTTSRVERPAPTTYTATTVRPNEETQPDTPNNSPDLPNSLGQNTEPGTAPDTEADPQPPATTTASPQVTPSPTLASENCDHPNPPVAPGSRFKPDNAADINKQIDALAVAYNDEKATTRDVFNAIAITTNATIDPEYAAALTFENNLLRQQANTGQPIAPLSAEQLLAKGFDQPDCLNDQQLHEIKTLFLTLIDNYGHKIGDQSSYFVKKEYQELKDAYQRFDQKYSAK